MSLSLDVHCSTCDYTGKCSIGSSRRSAGISFYFPYGCESCRKVVDVQHVGVDILACPDCGSSDLISFNTPEQWKAGDGYFVDYSYCVATGEDFKIAGHGIAYLCPSCRQLELRFEPGIRYE